MQDKQKQEVWQQGFLPLTSYHFQLKNPSCFSTGMYTKIYPWYHLNYRKDLRSLSAFNARPTSPLLAAALGSLLESVIHTSSVMRFSLSRTHFERILMLLLFVMAFIMCTLYHFKKKMSRLLSAFPQNSQQHTAQNLFCGGISH